MDVHCTAGLVSVFIYLGSVVRPTTDIIVHLLLVLCLSQQVVSE